MPKKHCHCHDKKLRPAAIKFGSTLNDWMGASLSVPPSKKNVFGAVFTGLPSLNALQFISNQLNSGIGYPTVSPAFA